LKKIIDFFMWYFCIYILDELKRNVKHTDTIIEFAKFLLALVCYKGQDCHQKRKEKIIQPVSYFKTSFIIAFAYTYISCLDEGDILV